jgi:SAM-dependent methyltransferase
MTSLNKKVLIVGGNNKSIPIPSCFDGWKHALLDIDPVAKPDILCDAREIWKLPPRQYDAVYCSHNLEHYHRHDLHKVLKGFKLILKKEGFIYIRVPDLLGVMSYVAEHNLDLTDLLYLTRTGAPIAALDVIYGFRKQLESSGVDFFCHRNGFSSDTLAHELKESGFPFVFMRENSLAFELLAIAFKQAPSIEIATLLELKDKDLYTAPEKKRDLIYKTMQHRQSA